MADPTIVFVLFGATGDLARRMVLPAFFDLHRRGLLPRGWLLVGNGRGDVSHEEFRQNTRDALVEFASEPDAAEWNDFAGHLRFAGGGFSTDDPGTLLEVVADVEEARYIHYLALPPTTYIPLVEALEAHGLVAGSRVVFEKPYGGTRDEFHELDRVVLGAFAEEQVFRIDHFLGKAPVQRLRALRFANAVFAGSWDREAIAEVQIDVVETLDVSDRVEFYDATGALLDVVSTHLFQLAADIAMEPPVSLSADDLREARASVIQAFRPIAVEDIVLGQFEGYRELDGVAQDSSTNTFAAVRLWIDTDRWRGVPFLLRSGKQLGQQREAVHVVFRKPDGPYRHGSPVIGNVLSVDLADDGEIAIDLVDGADGSTVRAALAARTGTRPAYSRLIADVIADDRSLFTTPDGLEATWDAIAPILDSPPKVQEYARGSMGPVAARDLAGPEGWRLGS